MDTTDQPPVSELLRSTAVPIAQLSPDNDRLPGNSVHSIVTLLWPYSSSTKTLSLLLAEPDFRLRRSNGQVKVFFHGQVAEEVARTHIGIGDKVYLSLAGSRLTKNDAATQTPGKGVSWDVHFDAAAFLEVWRDSKLLSTVKVDRESNTPPPTDNIAPSTPAANGGAHTFGPSGSTSWQSPAFLGKSRISFGFTDPAIEPLVEEDGYVPGKGRKRPRFSMRSNEWRVIDEPESPRDKELPEDWMATFDEELETGSDAGEEPVVQASEDSAIPASSADVPEIAPAVGSDASMVDAEPDASISVPVEPAVPDASTSVPGEPAEPDASTSVPGEPAVPDASTSLVGEPAGQSKGDDALFVRPGNVPGTKLVGLDRISHLPTDTPRLHPVPSPGLPLPSPFNTTSNSSSGYFGLVADTPPVTQPNPPAALVLEEVAELDDSDFLPEVQPHGEATHTDEEDAVTVYTDDMQILPSDKPSVLDSADGMSSPQPPGKMMAIDAPVNDVESGTTEGVSGHFAVDFAQIYSPRVQTAETHFESESVSGIDEGEARARIDSHSHKEEQDQMEDERSPEDLGQEDEGDQDKASDGRTEEDGAVDAPEIQQHKERLASTESFSPNESRDISPSRSQEYDEEDEEDVSDGSDEEASNHGDYECDYGDDEDDHRDGEGYGYSESEIASDYEEPLKVAPKNTEPEIIVLDSDSEDELSAKRPNDTREREAEGTPSEDSYDYEDQSQLGEDLIDEADSESPSEEDQENEHDMEDYNQSTAHEVEAESERSDDGKEYSQSVVYGHAVDEWESEPEQSEPERMDEDPQDGLEEPHEEDYQEPLDEEYETTYAEPPLDADENGPTNELAVVHEYYEDIQAITEYPTAPNLDSLDYLATISESAERLHSISESVQPSPDLAIDPSLYELGNAQGEGVQGENINEAAAEEYLRERSVEDNNETANEYLRTAHQRHLAFQLDGATPPGPVVEPLEISTSTHHEGRLLIIPGPSQSVAGERVASTEASSPIHASQDMLPTPNPTQDSPLKVKTEEQQQSFLRDEITSVLEGEDASPVLAVKSEEDTTAQREESEPEAPLVVVDNEVPPLLDDAQELQASIEVDEELEGNIDDAPYSPGDRRWPGLRSKLSYFAPLATLIDHYNALVDTISIASEVNPPTKAGSGRKDFIMTLQITDPSMAGATIYAQVLRPHKSALPSLQEGDAILLRNFRVKSYDHFVILVSDSTSAWAVFSGPNEDDDPDISGPPVEYGVEEKDFAAEIRIRGQGEQSRDAD
ncbi:uncharacterized protein DSM5745_00428 [Aspergillus mulundensis]|uniref:Telomeric single stranded DNA binding POT1/Cdc13 domain-containing protein n=1 Tax=Aspergillus mulundensis TaxID=1810919 RepID=A0A3D8T3H4_9EURO|nr:hypothetical protein DSM5745_00428 [Aspergillus mulundensis]RDW93106.1 hypothetical protein DSM5745_00428 [Aspergillus mulundensis]